MLQRVDIFSPVLDVEHGLLSRCQPSLSPAYLRWNYGTAEDDFSLDATAVGEPGPNLLVGNSASSTNNHVELFELIRAQLRLDGRKVIAPLSYGDPLYGQAVAALGRKIFGEDFVPLLTYLDKDRYIQTLASCSLLLLNTIRQQALGNVYISLQLGARVFLHRNSPMQSWLRRQGLPVGHVDQIDLKPLSPEQRQTQVETLQAAVGRHAQRARTRRLVDVLLGPETLLVDT